MTKEFSRLFGGLSLEEETTSKRSTDVDVRGNTDASTDNFADHSVEVERVPIRVEPAEALRNLETE